MNIALITKKGPRNENKCINSLIYFNVFSNTRRNYLFFNILRNCETYGLSINYLKKTRVKLLFTFVLYLNIKYFKGTEIYKKKLGYVTFVLGSYNSI